MGGGDYEVCNNHTTVDAPETVYHVREVFEREKGRGVKTTILYPTYKGEPVTMWSLIPQKRMPPTRIVRYCCQILKERSLPHRIIATGVRWDESSRRKTRESIEVIGRTRKECLRYTTDHAEEVFREAQGMDEVWDCNLITSAKKQKKLVVNPIIDWTEKDIWDYIHENNIKYNPLYDKGFKRVGCIGCPIAGGKKQELEFSLYPTYKRAYIRAFERMIEARKERGLETQWRTGQEVYDWWIGKKEKT
jgi:3'-phosphoadenosine 5'-phosphosulfate sulfotransferase (PAPS reductase)/FAD synthetase